MDILQALKEISNQISELGEKVSQLDRKVSELDGKVSQLDGKVSKLDGKVSKLDGKVNYLMELNSIGPIVRYLRWTLKLEINDFSLPCGRTFEFSSSGSTYVDSLKKIYFEDLWKSYTGLKTGAKDPEGIEFNCLGFAYNSSSLSGITEIIRLESPTSSSDQFGSYCSHAKFVDDRINCIVVFEITTADIAFNDKLDFPFKEANCRENASTVNLLNKLWQLERQVLFLASYNGDGKKGKKRKLESDSENEDHDELSIFHVGLCLPGKEDQLISNRQCIARVFESDFAQSIPLLTRLFKMNKFHVV